MKIFKRKINTNSIDKLNSYLNKIDYKSSKWIFPSNDLIIDELIKDFINSNNFLKSLLHSKKNYCVIRMVKKHEQKRSFEAHFDNYINTYYIPLKIPNSTERKGSLFIQENARKMPSNILKHIFQKIYFQIIMKKKYFKNFKTKFIKIDVDEGDIVFFNGFTSFHYNEDTSSEHRSLVIHNNMPFEKNILSKAIDIYSRLRVKN